MEVLLSITSCSISASFQASQAEEGHPEPPKPLTHSMLASSSVIPWEAVCSFRHCLARTLKQLFFALTDFSALSLSGRQCNLFPY